MTVRRLREQEGFGLVELLIAMTVMAIGITAIVAGFSSGVVAVTRASRIGTAGTLADKQMEAFRALPFSKIALNDASVTALSSTGVYKTDTALTAGASPGNADLTNGTLNTGPYYDGAYCTPASPAPVPVTCQPVQSAVVGPDNRTYRIDTYVVWSCPVGTIGGTTQAPTCTGTTTANAVKTVTVVVRDTTTTTKTWFRETSTFDANT